MTPREQTVRLLGLAAQDFTDIYEYVAAENQPASDRLLTRIERNLNTISAQPLLGRIPRDPDIARRGYR